MVKIEEIFIKLSEKGVHVYLDGEKLKTKSLKKTISPELVAIMRENKERIIEYLINENNLKQSSSKNKRTKIRTVSRNSTSFPLSFAQQRLWFIDQLDGGSSAYNIPIVLPINRKFDFKAAEQAFCRIIQRHEPLRSIFREEDGGPVQVIKNEFDFELIHYDLTALDERRQAIRVEQLTIQEREKIFDLSKDLMLRGSYLELSDEKTSRGLLLLTMHHIAADGWSMNIVSQEFAAQYHAIVNNKPDQLPVLDIQYVDFVYWQRAWLVGDILKKQLTYWRNQLAEIPQVHSLALDLERSSKKSHLGALLSESISSKQSNQLISLASHLKMTPFMLMHAVLALLLSRHSNSTDIVIATPVANRTLSEVEKLVGFFVNTLVLRVKTEFEYLSDYLEHVKNVNLDAQSNQDIPFESLVEKCQVPRSTQYTPLFQIMLTMNNSNKRRTESSQGYTFVDNVHAKFDLLIDVELGEFGGEVSWTFDKTLFTRSQVKTLNRHYQRLLNQIVTKPDSLLRDLQILSNQEIHHLTRELNNGTKKLDDNLLIHELFQRQAKQTPHQVAAVIEDIRFGCHQITYRELNARSNQIAHFLVEEGVKPDTLIGLYVDRSLEMLVGILAILKAGGAYVPLDPSYPKKRLEFMLSDSGVKLLLTHSRLVDKIVTTKDIKMIEIRSKIGKQRLDRYPISNIDRSKLNITSSQLAYVIYTSGTTGQPKGVMIEHINLLAFRESLESQFKLLNIQPNTPWLWNASYAFDASVKGLLSLLAGRQAVLVSEMDSKDPQAISRLINNYGIEVFNGNPYFVSLLIDELEKLDVVLPQLIVSGEKIPGKIFSKLLSYCKNHQRKVINAYGPTETTINSAFALIKDRQAIGRPTSHTMLYVLDKCQRVVPFGVVGELYIGGYGVGRGYLNLPELTKEKFIAHPFCANVDSLLYRTGDLVRYHTDGNLEFIGRIDKQIKIRGFRIELGEIEQLLNQLDVVESAIVLVRQEETEQQRIVAYVLAKPDQDKHCKLLVNQLKQTLGSQIPKFMMPSAIILIDEWPLTVSGKLDEEALPASDGRIYRDEYIAPSTETEKKLADVWAKLLKLNAETLSTTSSFFDLGGHSLLAVRLVSEIRARFKQEIALATIFDSPTIAVLSLKVDAGSERELRKTIKPVTRQGDKLLLSFAQERLWFVDKMTGGGTEYNIPFTLPIKNEFNIDIAERALNRIIQRHQPLRTIFAESEGRPFQIVQTELKFELKRYDLTKLAKQRKTLRVEEIIRSEQQKPFNLSRDLMIRGAFVALTNPTEELWGILQLTLHHIAFDGWSMSLLRKEFYVQYQTITEEKPDPLPSLSLHYADYAQWQRQWLQSEILAQQFHYWSKQLSEVPRSHSLPLDFPRPEIKSHAGAVVSESLSATFCQDLLRIAKQYQVTPFMLLHGALCLLLSRHSNSRDIVLGTPVANRLQAELESLIGFFVNTLVLRVNTGFEFFSDFIEHIKQVNLDSQTNQEVPFEKLVELCQVPRTTQYTPLVQIMFSMNTINDFNSRRAKKREMVVRFLANATAKFDLSIQAEVTASGGEFTWEYDTSLFTRAHIEVLNAHFQRLLQSIIKTPESPLRDLAMLSVQESNYLSHELNYLEKDHFSNRCVHELFEKQVATKPQAIALAFQDKNQNVQLSFDTLNKRANQFARYLISERSVKPDTLIGVCMQRSIEMVISILAILKAGGAYVPIDPDYPTARLEHMLVDSELNTVITQARFLDRLLLTESQTVNLDCKEFNKNLQNQPSCNITKSELDLSINNLAYVIYTSGSTGKPKGVMITHQNVEVLINDVNFISIKGDDVVAHAANVSFDAITFEIWGALCNGARVALIKKENLITPKRLEAVLQKNSVTILFVTTALYNQIATNCECNFRNLRYLLFGGERASRLAIKYFLDKNSTTRLVHVYGPTEATTFTTYVELTQDNINQNAGIPIGKPMQNNEVYVLDDSANLLPLGCVGELYIGGRGLARGYLNRPELTAKKFIVSPFNQMQRLYRTGDLVCYSTDNNLVFMGRVDNQVKMRGYRIELGEIESQLNSCDEVVSCLVMIQEQEDEQKQLVAYLIPEYLDSHDDNELVGRIRHRLKSQLPNYMLPSAYVLVEEWPITANGKIDKFALPASNNAFYQGVYVGPGTETERELVAIWSKLLKLDVSVISITANFFELGGHSLLAVRLVSEVRSRLDYEISTKSVFEHSDIKSLGYLIESSTKQKDLLQEHKSSKSDDIEEIEW